MMLHKVNLKRQKILCRLWNTDTTVYTKKYTRKHKFVVVNLKGNDFGSQTHRMEAKGLSLYYPKLLHCSDKMLEGMVLNPHWVLSCKTVRPGGP